jgi:hypothetical protein
VALEKTCKECKGTLIGQLKDKLLVGVRQFALRRQFRWTFGGSGYLEAALELALVHRYTQLELALVH